MDSLFEQGGRGYHPKNVLVDEADYCPQFLTVILPLLSEKNVGLIAMSSPNYAGGVYSTIISAVDNKGKKMVNSMILGDPCDLCITTSTPEKCDHKLCEMASWKDPERTEYLRKLYTVIGQEGIFRAELGTMARASSTNEFPRDSYIDFVSSDPKVSDDKIESVYIGVDPAYGGACDFAITAIGQVTRGTKPGFQVIAFCAERITTPREKDVHIQAIIDGVIMAIRTHPRIAGRNVPIIVSIEACASDGTFLGPMFLRHIGVLVMTEFSTDRHKFGVPKTKNTLIGMIMATKTFLSREMITIPSDCIGFSSQNSVLKMTMARYRSTLAVQFSNFRTDTSTGTTNGKGGGANDDLLISFMMAIYWMLVFPTRNLPEYIHFRDEYPVSCWAGAALVALGIDR